MVKTAQVRNGPDQNGPKSVTKTAQVFYNIIMIDKTAQVFSY